MAFNQQDTDYSSKNESGSSEVMDPNKLDRAGTNTITKWEKEPTIIDLKADIEFARQDNTDQANNVAGWLALRNTTGKESGNKTDAPGRSKTQPKLIRKHNEWRYPALSEPFLDTDRMFDINPRTGKDKQAAKQNQLVLNWQFDTKIDKVAFIDRYIRKVVDEGTCIFRVGWKRETEKVSVDVPVYEYFPLEGPDAEDQLQVLAMATELYVTEDPEYDALPEDLQASVEYSANNQTPVYAKQSGTEKKYETKIITNQPEVSIINIKNFFYDPSCEGVWQDSQYFAITYETTRSALKKRKMYKNLDKVSWATNTVQATAGNQDHATTTPQTDSRLDNSKTKILVYEYWGLFDIHNDGSMIPIVVTWIGDTIIQMTENPFPDRKPPFVIVPYMPIADSIFGEADASLLQDNQRIAGGVKRGVIDLLGRSANGQTGMAKGFVDALNKKRIMKGQDFEFNPNSDPRTGMQQMVYPEIPNSALQVLGMENSEAESLSGVKAFSAGITGDAFGKVARGVTKATDAAGQREVSILRRLAEGMRLVGTKIIAMNQVYLEEVEVVRVTDEEFVEVKREDLIGNFDLKLSISTANSDEAKAQDLGMMLQTQGPSMDPGLEQVILADIAELKRMPALAKQIRDYKPEPDPLQVKMQELQIAKLESEIALEKAKAKEALAKAENIALDTELDATGTSHERNMEATKSQSHGNRSLEITKSLLGGESQVGNIEAAVGFNKLTELADGRATDLPTPPTLPEPELAPLQSAQPIPIQ